MSIDVKNPVTGAQAVVANASANASDISRRNDVLFRVRREPGEEMSSWVPVAGFLAVTVAVVSLLAFIPGGS